MTRAVIILITLILIEFYLYSLCSWDQQWWYLTAVYGNVYFILRVYRQLLFSESTLNTAVKRPRHQREAAPTSNQQQTVMSGVEMRKTQVSTAINPLLQTDH